MLLCARAFALQNGQNLGWNYFAPTPDLRTCKNFLCPAAARARIVLALFIRSCSADGWGNESFKDVSGTEVLRSQQVKW